MPKDHTDATIFDDSNDGHHVTLYREIGKLNERITSLTYTMGKLNGVLLKHIKEDH